MSRLLSWFLLPLQLSVFLLLHLSYGVYRVYFHIKHRPRHLVTEATDLEQHAATWKAHKLPNHLAVAFAPPPKTLISAWRVKSRKKRQQQLLEDAARFVDWAQRAGIQRVSVFDSQDILKEASDALEAHLSTTSTVARFAPSILTISNTSGQSIQLHILGLSDGKPFLGRITGDLSLALSKGFLQQENITVPFLQHKISSAGYDEPQLLIVLGGYLLKLHHFPPWQIRLTEIYHEPSFELLGPPKLEYSTFKKALDGFAKCEQRFGK